MDKGIPNCSDCGGKGMCPKHKLEYLKWVADTAQNEYLEELRNQSQKQESERKTR
ncbi:unnamed protein product [marine sediment metagenome]|uniref:Uncharacterized protein n=1 Tax=marine sediment metagenome TaxID=412755 RepID=X1AE69_9ZZZZ